MRRGRDHGRHLGVVKKEIKEGKDNEKEMHSSGIRPEGQEEGNKSDQKKKKKKR